MRVSLVTALALVVTAVAADDQEGCICEVKHVRSRRSVEWGYSMSSALVDSQTIRINKLTEMVEELEHKLASGAKGRELYDQAHELERMVEKQERPMCDKWWEMSCGRSSGQCVAELLVCDNHQDCENGLDEHPDTCANPVPPGTVWTGTVTWTGCVDESKSRMRILVTGNQRYDAFPSRMRVWGRVEVYTGEIKYGREVTDKYDMVGSYSYGMKRVTMEPEKSSKDKLTLPMGLVCYDGGPGRAECKFVSIGDLHECGTAVFNAEH